MEGAHMNGSGHNDTASSVKVPDQAHTTDREPAWTVAVDGVHYYRE